MRMNFNPIGYLYKNEKGMVKRKPDTASASEINITDHQKILGLSYLGRLSTKNLRQIGEIKSELTKRPVISSATTAFILLVFYLTIRLYRAHSNRRRDEMFRWQEKLTRPQINCNLFQYIS